MRLVIELMAPPPEDPDEVELQPPTVKQAAAPAASNPDLPIPMLSSSLRQTVEPRPEPVQGHGNADALLGRLEDDEGRGLALPHLVDQGVFHDDLGDTARCQTAHE